LAPADSSGEDVSDGNDEEGMSDSANGDSVGDRPARQGLGE